MLDSSAHTFTGPYVIRMTVRHERVAVAVSCRIGGTPRLAFIRSCVVRFARKVCVVERSFYVWLVWIIEQTGNGADSRGPGKAICKFGVLSVQVLSNCILSYYTNSKSLKRITLQKKISYKKVTVDAEVGQ